MTADVDRDALEAELAHERSQLESLRAAERQASERIRTLEQALASRAERTAGEDPPPAVTPATPPASGPRSAAEKVRLFRAIFRGRDDVHARRWSNARTGRQGYAPVCAHEWQPGLCGKPRVRCAECPSRAFLPLTDTALLEHLQGRHTLGLYPLLADEREAGHPLAVSFRGELTGPQRAAALALLAHETGVFVAPPGSGKTVLATHLIAARARSTLV